MVMPVHIESFIVRSYEIDSSGRLTIPSLFCYLQESASNHATEYGLSMNELRSRGLTWMISRIHLEMRRYPCWGETVTVETWPSLRKKYFAFREFLCSGVGGDELCRATTSWLVVDTVRNRPAVLEERGIEYDLPDRGRIIEDDFRRLPAPRSFSYSFKTEALQHTIDYNNHVGSVQYLRWLFDAVPTELIKSHVVSSLEIRFQYQALLNDVIRSGVEILNKGKNGEELTSLHELYNVTQDKKMAIARVMWVKFPLMFSHFPG